MAADRLEARSLPHGGMLDRWPITAHGVATPDEVERAIVRLGADDAALAYRLQGFIHEALSAAPVAPVGEATEAMRTAGLSLLLAEIADLKVSVIAFCGPHAATYAREFALPKDHLHPVHYDLLERCGARMVAFTRADVALSAGEAG